MKRDRVKLDETECNAENAVIASHLRGYGRKCNKVKRVEKPRQRFCKPQVGDSIPLASSTWLNFQPRGSEEDVVSFVASLQKGVASSAGPGGKLQCRPDDSWTVQFLSPDP